MKFSVIALILVPLAAKVMASQSLAVHGAVLKNDLQDLLGCVSHADQWLLDKRHKEQAITKAIAHCEASSKVDDRKISCPAYQHMLRNAFEREEPSMLYTAATFCAVTEQYVAEMSQAADIPHMGKGKGFEFKLAKTCKTAAAKAMKTSKWLPAESAPNFWYGLCLNQDCAHYLPSRTRWCTKSHAPTHSATVCNSLRSFVKSHVDLKKSSHLASGELCKMYGSFVQNTNVDYESYMHVVHGKKKSVVLAAEIYVEKSMAGFGSIPSLALALLALRA